MKLSRLESRTQRPSATASVPRRPVAEQDVRRVEAMEAVEDDRQRSLQQELRDFEAREIAPLVGREHMLQDARQLAAELTLLGSNRSGLLKLLALSHAFSKIDDRA
jgi:hypothetical protein